MSINIGKFPDVGPNQIQTMGADFGKFLPAGVTLTGTPTLTLSVKFGTDSSPSSRISTAIQVGTISTVLGGSGITNAALLWQVSGCQVGTEYVADFYCARSDGDQIERSANFTCSAAS